MTVRVSNPFPFFLDRAGLPLDGGSIYVGTVGDDPEISPVTVYLNKEMTITVAQPLSVIGGLSCNDGNPVMFYVNATNYSLRVRDADGAEVFYVASAVVDNSDWQPVDSDLTAIAALATTPYGRGVLEMASASALRSYVGVVDALPLSGGTVTGNIVRSGAGPHPYFTDASFTSGRIFITEVGAADPTSALGDQWIVLAP